MNAREARQIAFDFNTKQSEGQYNKIITAITNSAGGGEYECYFYDTIKPDVRNKLLDEGFVVDQPQSGGPNETMVKISWQ